MIASLVLTTSYVGNGPPGPPGGLPTQANGWLGPFSGQARVTLALLPVAALIVWALTRRRCVKGLAPAQALRISLAEVSLVYGTLPFVWLTMQPGSEAGAVASRVSLMPFRDMVTMPLVEVVGNLLVFGALGFFGPLRFPALRSLTRILALAAAGSLLIETMQDALRLDRVSSIDDVLLNTAGAGLAALASRRWWRAHSRRALSTDVQTDAALLAAGAQSMEIP